MQSKDIFEIINQHQERYRKMMTEEPSDINHYCNGFLNDLNSLKKEIKLFELVYNSTSPYESIEILSEVGVDKKILDLFITMVEK